MKISFKPVVFKVVGIFALGMLASSVSVHPTASVAAPAKGKAAPQVVWAKSYTAAVQEAKKTKKPVFIDFYTDWCGPCKYLEQTTYKDQKFVAASRKWVMVKINPEKSQLGAQLAKKYKIEGYPAMVMIQSTGRKLNGVTGAYPAQLLLPEMDKAYKAHRGSAAKRA